jgi:zinc transporter
MNTRDAPPGTLHALLLDGKGGASQVGQAEITRWQPEQGCLWLHFDYTEPGSRQWLEQFSGLNDIAMNGLLSEETRPRVLRRGNILLLSLRGINHNPGEEPNDMVSLRIWTDGARVFSARRRPLRATDAIVDDLNSGDGPKDALELLVEWTDRIVWNMSGTVDGFEDKVMALENAVLDEKPGNLRHALADLRKETISVRRYLAPQREAMNRLCGEPVTWIDELNRLRLREITDRQIRHIEDIDFVRERASVVQEELTSRLAEQMNARMYVLSIVAAVFLPLGFLTGLMGINVGGMPGIDSDIAFWVVVAICGGVFTTLAVVFRIKRWL